MTHDRARCPATTAAPTAAVETAHAAVPVDAADDPGAAPDRRPPDWGEVEEFLRQFHHEEPGQPVPLATRLARVREEIDRTGSYRHTTPELEFGCKIAWRNTARCNGRLYWRSLKILDRRAATTPDEIHRHLLDHLRIATNGGRIRPVISVFAPDTPQRPGPRLWNSQLIRYAGHRSPSGEVVGDPAQVPFTDVVRRLGWQPKGGPHDILPLVVEVPDDRPRLYEVPPEDVLEVPITHPDVPGFDALDLRWYAVPAISHMRMSIGGVNYPLAPFNGWYMGTEIGARNLVDADRYDLLPVVADLLGLDTSSETTLWRDRALVELNVAVLQSFERAGVKITDHHTASRHFLTHVEREESLGRPAPTDWSWIVPPLSGGITPVFHRYYDEDELKPNFFLDDDARARAEGRCPVPHGAPDVPPADAPDAPDAPDVPDARDVPDDAQLSSNEPVVSSPAGS
ncbi:nitric oxide synthase oxygenase [Streptomyces sp. 3MP-14]|uniref:Nitric oxide synthase oxygenase n=1 Tax=Streptomyces mimosae TaxID=2586635 RepID=A0A5N6A4L5_9ACTN|nr:MULTISPECIES: nitric oxide synthase oxygenase [Streptomyces]KAB8163724.1 nitric oxide synthase oxygenase [Streptomyces mimosae]KAB8175167.1 nitric oxide synthase oxygenase [Streptomyces sp. 3MP-14]